MRDSNMCRVFSFLFLAMGLVSIQAQNHYLDSLANLLPSSEISDSMRMRIYYQVIWPNTYQNPEYALGLTDDMIAIAERNNWPKWWRTAHYYYGTSYKNMGKFALAAAHIDTVYNAALEIRDTVLLANSAYQQLVINRGLQDFQSAIRWSNIAVGHYNYLGDKRSVAMTENTKAGLYRSFKLYDKAIETYQSALEIRMEHHDTVGIAYIYNNLGNVYSELDSFTLALSYYNKQEHIDSVLGDTIGLGYVFENKGRLLAKMGDYDHAIALLRKSATIRRNYRHENLLATTLIELGAAYFEKGMVEQAFQSLTEAMGLVEELDLLQQKIDGVHLGSKISAERGDYNKAYQQLLLHSQLKDSALNETISLQSLQIDALTDYENLQQKKELEHLAVQGELQDLRLRQSSANLKWAICGLLVSIAFLVWISHSRNSLKRAKEQLEEQKNIISKSLEEKEYLLKEIHHRVKNNLQVISSMLKLQSRSLDDKRAQQALDEGRNRVRSMALIHQNLYQDSSDLSVIDVPQYLDKLTKELLTTYKVDPEQVRVTMDICEIKLDIDTLIPLGLIVNELISNSLKYAFPDSRRGTVDITLEETPKEELRLVVKDDGVGFDLDRVSGKSFGHRMIRAFAGRLKAQLRFDGSDGAFAEVLIHEYGLT